MTIDTVNDWKRIKSNFSSATFAALDEVLETGGSSVDKNALLPHIDQVWLCIKPGLLPTHMWLARIVYSEDVRDCARQCPSERS